MSLIYMLVPLETVFAATGKIQGRCDSKLSKSAMRPVADLKRHLYDLSLTTAYTSPQERAILTANACELRIMGLKDALMDWDFGLFEAQRDFLLPQKKNDDYGDFFAQHGYQGETADEVDKRLCHVLTQLVTSKQEQKLLCISGVHAIYNFYLKHTANHLRQLNKQNFTPASLHVFNWSNDQFTYLQSYFPTLTADVDSIVQEGEYITW